MPRLLLSVLIAGFLGTGLVFLFWPFRGWLKVDLWIKLSLSVALGYGISSCVFFVWLMAFGAPGIGFMLTEGALAILLVAALFYRFRHSPPSRSLELPTQSQQKLKFSRLLSLLFYAGAISALVTSISMLIRSPDGHYDAIAIWNMRARFIFRGGTRWTDAFSSILSWSHPDYPLLLPLSVARGWSYVGYETLFVPGTIAITFMLATIIMLVSSLSVLRSKTQGYLAGLVFLAPALVIRTGSSEYADIPLGFFMLATIILFYLQDTTQEGNSAFLILAGLTAGFAAWTKNEGLLFLVSIVIARFVIFPFAHGLGRLWIEQLLFFLLGLIPILLILVYFKFKLAPANELVASRDFQSTLKQLLTLSRYTTILAALKKEMLVFGGWIVNPIYLLIMYPICVGVRLEVKNRLPTATAIVAISLVSSGYFFVYVTTPHDLNWHLESSLNRLLLQLWPTFVFIYFMIARTPEEALLGSELEASPERENPSELASVG